MSGEEHGAKTTCAELTLDAVAVDDGTDAFVGSHVLRAYRKGGPNASIAAFMARPRR